MEALQNASFMAGNMLVLRNCLVDLVDQWEYCISSINTVSSISTPVQYYSNTNNIKMVVIFINSAPSNSTACNFATPNIIANYRVMMEISSIVVEV